MTVTTLMMQTVTIAKVRCGNVSRTPTRDLVHAVEMPPTVMVIVAPNIAVEMEVIIPTTTVDIRIQIGGVATRVNAVGVVTITAIIQGRTTLMIATHVVTVTSMIQTLTTDRTKDTRGGRELTTTDRRGNAGNGHLDRVRGQKNLVTREGGLETRVRRRRRIRKRDVTRKIAAVKTTTDSQKFRKK